ncbi:MAG: Trk system potassium transporter TrkA [Bryobacterales bacterium]|nr:Trk system potassium transporter TrkA [Bryobacterales bacterium]
MRILIAGGGEVASLLARRLIREGNEITILEEDPARCAHLNEYLDARIVRGSAIGVRSLREAGLADAEMVIAVTSFDSVNLLCCMVAEAESKAKIKVARIRTHEVEHWRHIAAQSGLRIDLIIHPESEIATRLPRVLRVPGVSDIYEFAGGEVKLFGMHVEPGNWVIGKTMEELDRAGPPKNSLIAMIFRGSQVIIPRGPDRIEEGDHVYIVTTATDLDADFAFMGVHAQREVRRVFILGGKQLGIRIAEDLEKQGKQVKLFERDAARCEKIAGILRDTVVVHGDGTDEATLVEENIDGIDAFLALTNDDEDNIIASLLARRLGAKKVVALINRLNYIAMAQRLGIHTTVSPRLAAVDRILQFVRKGRVMSVTTFRQEEAEAIELIAPRGSKYVGKKLRDLHLPHGAIVGAIARADGEVLIPRGDASIEVGDRVIFFALESVVPKLESAFLRDDPERRG